MKQRSWNLLAFSLLSLSALVACKKSAPSPVSASEPVLGGVYYIHLPATQKTPRPKPYDLSKVIQLQTNQNGAVGRLYCVETSWSATSAPTAEQVKALNPKLAGAFIGSVATWKRRSPVLLYVAELTPDEKAMLESGQKAAEESRAKTKEGSAK